MTDSPVDAVNSSMVRWRAGVVTGVRRRWHGTVELDVVITGRTQEEDPETPARALAYPALVGTPEVGDRVLLNTTALAMGLGTGGYAVVIADLDRLPPDPTGPGHLVKARYTPLQATVLGVDEQDSPAYETIRSADGVGGMPVVVADLHSALPAIVAGVHERRPDARIAYVMTDGGALPAWFSRTLDGLRDDLAATITVGQAFGGDHEAVTVHSGLLAARQVVGADLAIVTQGPGNLGTGTQWGFSGVAAGEAVNAAYAVGGRPVGALRISGADHRSRHFGVSHHSTTAFFRVALCPLDVVRPLDLRDDLAAEVEAGLGDVPSRVRVVSVRTTGLDAALRASPVTLSTMGRSLDEDLEYFLAGAAAGRHAASLLR